MTELTEEQIFSVWQQADRDKSGTLSFKEVLGLLEKFNLKLKERYVKKIFKEVDVDGSGQLDYQEFRLFLSLLRERSEVVQLFDMFYEIFHEDDDVDEEDESNKYWTDKELKRFLKEYQKEENISEDYISKMIEELEPKKKHKKSENEESSKKFSKIGLMHYMQSIKYNSIFRKEHNSIYQDMKQPFSHYFIASSHNTYLLGDQLKGESSVDAYINAFKKGCKCVELDCWDGDDKVPIIYHGHTLTSKILFKDVIKCVKEFGFIVSDYPVILSLEVHCSVEGQVNMAKILEEVLGKEYLPPCPEDTKQLLTPEDYKRKVLIKGKRLSSSVSVTASAPEDSESDDEEDNENNEEQSEKLTPSDSKEETSTATKKKEKKTPQKTAKELSDLVHLKTAHMKSFKENKEKGPCAWSMSSFAEGKVNKFVSKSPQEFLEYNNYQLSRIYPKGLRVDSSNYDPVPSWNCGSQIVALNYQTGSEPMWLNDGKFNDNGRAGYILKPKFMREKEITWNPNTINNPNPLNLNIKIISGWQFPKVSGKEHQHKGEVIDPYIKLNVYGIPKDTAAQKTRTIKNNGFNPVWNSDHKFSIHSPELAILLFTVMDEDTISKDDFIAQYAINVYNIREGFRVVPLFDKKGASYKNASLLVHISFTEKPEIGSSTKVTDKYEGNLYKKANSSWTNKWNLRYFITQNNELKYYQSKADTKKVRACFSVKNVSFGPIKSQEKNYSHAFMVVAPQRTLYLRTETAKEFKAWKRNLLAQGAQWDPKLAKDFTVNKDGAVKKT